MTRFIAEIGSNHNRESARCLELVDAAAAAGCQAVKLQVFHVEDLFAAEALARDPRLAARRAWELPLELLAPIRGRCEQRGIELGATPFGLWAVEALGDHVDFFKIASYELLWHELIRACAASGKPLVLSTGMATLAEVAAAVEVARSNGAEPRLLHCVSGYPASPEQANLAAIATLRERFGVPVGWSDHTCSEQVVRRAVRRWGAGEVELHIDLDGAGLEAGEHNWTPERLRALIVSLGESGQDDMDGNPEGEAAALDGDGVKRPMPVELPDVPWRADPVDGLRPLRSLRGELVGAWMEPLDLRTSTCATLAMDPTRAPAGQTASKAPLVIVLTEGGPRIGLGHVGRCLAIREELEGRVAFAVEGLGSARMLAAHGVARVPAGTPAPVVLIDRREPTSAGVVASLQAEGRRVCLLDDPGEARASADLVIDPPTGCSWPPAGGRRLAGFEHVLLRAEMRAAAVRPRAGVEVLLSMGGSDPEGLTPALAQALRVAGASVLTVLGPAYRGGAPAGEVLDGTGGWPSALAGARLLVGRFGHTLLEAAYLGTPALAIATSASAGAEAEAFAAHGTIEAIRVHGPGDARAVAERALALLADAPRLAAMAARGRELVDGGGAARVAAALRELAR